MDAVTSVLQLGDLSVDVVLKDIKNVHLSVHPPTGRVRVSAPSRMEPEAIRLFAISRLNWIRTQQKKLLAQERDTPKEYLERESHWLWGKRYLLSIETNNKPPTVELGHNQLLVSVRPGTGDSQRGEIIEAWYREQVRSAAIELVSKWEPRIGVEVARVFVRRMKTRWGSCNAQAQTIRLNTDLARKPKQCLEYIVVHEMVHILVPNHSEDFQALMKQHIPTWKHRRRMLNELPVRHEEWDVAG